MECGEKEGWRDRGAEGEEQEGRKLENGDEGEKWSRRSASREEKMRCDEEKEGRKGKKKRIFINLTHRDNLGKAEGKSRGNSPDPFPSWHNVFISMIHPCLSYVKASFKNLFFFLPFAPSFSLSDPPFPPHKDNIKHIFLFLVRRLSHVKPSMKLHYNFSFHYSGNSTFCYFLFRSFVPLFPFEFFSFFFAFFTSRIYLPYFFPFYKRFSAIFLLNFFFFQGRRSNKT